jgi:hypothetical protein
MCSCVKKITSSRVFNQLRLLAFKVVLCKKSAPSKEVSAM